MARALAMATRGKQRYSVNDLHYLAGVVDSDGCIAIGKMQAGMQRTKNPRYVLMITVANTCETLMVWLESKFGGKYRMVRKENPRHKAHYHWSFNNGQALWLLRELAPILIVKPAQARLGIEFLSKWKTPAGGTGKMTDPKEVARREVCYQKMKGLNAMGPRKPRAAATTKSLGPCLQQGDAIV